ncbi:hypothetical protein [Microbacterium sp. CH-015]|uniref:hypothetical protein n=1 Tax=Microbacterium sp. CH-015 TaxID=3406734 RepID=UPI003C7472A9
MTEPATEPEISTRLLPPATRRKSEPPRWEVRLGPTIIGWIEARRIGGASATFYFAYGLIPGTGETVNLESNIEFDERVDLLRRFHADPMVAEQHLNLGYSGDRPQS